MSRAWPAQGAYTFFSPMSSCCALVQHAGHVIQHTYWVFAGRARHCNSQAPSCACAAPVRGACVAPVFAAAQKKGNKQPPAKAKKQGTPSSEPPASSSTAPAPQSSASAAPPQPAEIPQAQLSGSEAAAAEATAAAAADGLQSLQQGVTAFLQLQAALAEQAARGGDPSKSKAKGFGGGGKKAGGGSPTPSAVAAASAASADKNAELEHAESHGWARVGAQSRAAERAITDGLARARALKVKMPECYKVDTRVPRLHAEYQSARPSWPAGCDPEASARFLRDAHDLARVVPGPSQFELLHEDPAAAVKANLLHRVGSGEEAVARYEFLTTAKRGEVFQRKKRGVCDPRLLPSFSGDGPEEIVLTPVRLLSPAPLWRAVWQRLLLFSSLCLHADFVVLRTLTDCVAFARAGFCARRRRVCGPEHAPVVRFPRRGRGGGVLLARGVVWSLFVMPPRVALRRSDHERRSISRRRLQASGPVRWVGLEASAYCVAKTLVIARMLEEAEAARDILQACGRAACFCTFIVVGLAVRGDGCKAFLFDN